MLGKYLTGGPELVLGVKQSFSAGVLTITILSFLSPTEPLFHLDPQSTPLKNSALYLTCNRGRPGLASP